MSGIIRIASGDIGGRDDSLMINQMETLSLADSNSISLQNVNYPATTTSYESGSIISGISIESGDKRNLLAPSTVQGSSLDTDIRELLRKFKPNPWPRSDINSRYGIRERSGTSGIRDRPRANSIIARSGANSIGNRSRSSILPRSTDITIRRKRINLGGIELFLPIKNNEKTLVMMNYISTLANPSNIHYPILIRRLVDPFMEYAAPRLANIQIGFLTKRWRYVVEKSYLFTLEEQLILVEELFPYTSDLQILVGPMKRSFSDVYTTSEIVEIVANFKRRDTFSSDYTEFLNKYLSIENVTRNESQNLNEGGRQIMDMNDPLNLELLRINSRNFTVFNAYKNLYPGR